MPQTTAVTSIDRDELTAKIDRSDPFVILETLAAEHFHHAHHRGMRRGRADAGEVRRFQQVTRWILSDHPDRSRESSSVMVRTSAGFGFCVVGICALQC